MPRTEVSILGSGLIGVFAAFAAIAPASAEVDCNAVLVGIYDHQFIDSDKVKIERLLDVLEQHGASSYQTANNIAVNAGATLPIEGIPVQFQLGYKTDSSNSGTWAQDLKRYFEHHTGERSHYIEQLQTANALVIEAWKTCITTKRQRALTLTPLQADLPITGQDQPFTIELLFNAEGVPLEQIPKATKLVFDNTQLILRTPLDEIVGKRVPYNLGPKPILFARRKSYKGAIEIAVYTGDPNVSAAIHLRAFPEPAKAAPPSIAKTKIDFDGDRIPDTYVLGTHSINVTLGNRAPVPGGNQVISDDFNPRFPNSPWLAGDFENTGLTGLMYVVTDGTPYIAQHHGYVHYFRSNGDGTFTGRQFDFSTGIDYDAKGTWIVENCPAKDGRSRLKHTININHTINYNYWHIAEDGNLETNAVCEAP